MARQIGEKSPEYTGTTEKDLTRTSVEARGARNEVGVEEVIQAQASPEEEKRVLRKIDLQ